MATIRAACPDCGDVEFDQSRITVRQCLTDNSWTYRFSCPGCERSSVHSTSEALASELIWVECAVEVWLMPERDSDVVGEPFTHDDLLDFVDSLPEFIESLLP